MPAGDSPATAEKMQRNTPADARHKTAAAAQPPAKRRRRTQAERSAESERRMLRAALKLIGERGYRGTSLAAIGEKAGYSRGLVSERFGSKDGLLWALVKDMMRAWRRDLEVGAQEPATGLDELDNILDNHRRVLEQRGPIRAFYALMFEAIGPVPQLLPEFRKLHRGFRADVERIFRTGIEAGTFRADLDPRAQAVVLLGALRGIGFQWLLEPDGFSLDAAYGTLKRNLRRSVAP